MSNKKTDPYAGDMYQGKGGRPLSGNDRGRRKLVREQPRGG